MIVSLGAYGLSLLHLRGTAGMLFGTEHPYRLWAPTTNYPGLLLRQLFFYWEAKSGGYPSVLQISVGSPGGREG